MSLKYEPASFVFGTVLVAGIAYVLPSAGSALLGCWGRGGHLYRFEELLPGKKSSHGQNVAPTVLCVPNSLESGVKHFTLYLGRRRA